MTEKSYLTKKEGVKVMDERNGTKDPLSKWGCIPPGDLRPGIIVLQYVNDDKRFVGVIVNDYMSDQLSSDDLHIFELHRKEYHICLVLGYFSDFDEQWSMFTKKERILFPYYSIGKIRAATPTDLKEEMNLFRLLCKEGVCRGLQYGKLRQRMFMFSKKVQETLGMVAFVQHYMDGGGIEDRPKWFYFSDNDAESVYIELLKAIPRP